MCHKSKNQSAIDIQSSKRLAHFSMLLLLTLRMFLFSVGLLVFLSVILFKSKVLCVFFQSKENQSISY